MNQNGVQNLRACPFSDGFVGTVGDRVVAQNSSVADNKYFAKNKMYGTRRTDQTTRNNEKKKRKTTSRNTKEVKAHKVEDRVAKI